MNNNTHFTPVEVVGNLDMVGTLLCMIGNGVDVPREVLKSAITVLAATRGSLADQHGLPATAIHNTREYREQIGVDGLDF